MNHVRHVRLNELDPKGGPVFEGLTPMTPWSVFDYRTLAPGETLAGGRYKYRNGL